MAYWGGVREQGQDPMKQAQQEGDNPQAGVGRGAHVLNLSSELAEAGSPLSTQPPHAPLKGWMLPLSQPRYLTGVSLPASG